MRFRLPIFVMQVNTTALIEAALYSNYHIAVLLLEARADKETKNEVRVCT